MSAVRKDLEVESGIVQWVNPDPENNIAGTEIKPGNLYSGLPNGLYHKGPGISKSGLDLIRRSPMHYKFMKENPRPSTPALVIGQALHCLVLEGEEQFHKEFCRAPANAPNKPTAAQLRAEKPTPAALKSIQFWAEFNEENKGKQIISSKSDPEKGDAWGVSDWDKLFRMRDAIMEHPTASALLDSGLSELSGYWIDRSIDIEQLKVAAGKKINLNLNDPTFKLCKLRLDWFSDTHNLGIDLKTTEDASYTEFSRSVDKFRYHVQDAFYREGMSQLNRPLDEFVFVAIEKQPPYAVACYTIDLKGKRFGKSLFQRDLSTYAYCKANDEWPLYPSDVRELEMLPYAYKVNIF